VQKLSPLLIMLTVVLAIAGCGGGQANESTSAADTSSTPATTSSTPSAATAQISTKTLPGLGPILVNGQGHILYIFVPDKHKQVTCLSTCAQIWPPVKLPNAQKPAVSGQAKSSLAGSDPDSEGGRVLTYAGWPLYTYIADSTSGSASGQGLNTNGGLWYVLSPSGAVVTKTP
jgi:predicted lipoprotein with Yx(FWY)xxD motif